MVGDAPCQCFSPGSIQTVSPGRISWIGSPHFCTRPSPDMTNSVCPRGWVCQLVRAAGSNVTTTARTRAGAGASLTGSCRTVPVKFSAAGLAEGREPTLLISMAMVLLCWAGTLA